MRMEMEHRNSVLIVEDDVNINGLLKEALEKEGYICTPVSYTHLILCGLRDNRKFIAEI